MVTILPKEESFLGEGLQKFGQSFTQGYQNRADEMALQRAIGGLSENATPRQILDAVTGTKTYSPEAKQNLFKNYLSAYEAEERKKTKEETVKKEEEKFKEQKRATEKAEEQRDRNLALQEKKAVKVEKSVASQQQIKSGLQTVKEMRDIGAKGNLGIGVGVRKLLSDEAAKDAGEYEQLGKSLIALSTTIPIRNRLEFETLAEKLYDPSIRDAEREGVLTAMENILNRSLIEEEHEVAKQVGGDLPEGKIRVRNKQTGKTGSVTPFEGMDAKYDRI